MLAPLVTSLVLLLPLFYGEVYKLRYFLHRGVEFATLGSAVSRWCAVELEFNLSTFYSFP